MRKADRPHPFGGTYGQRSIEGWWNWYAARGRFPMKTESEVRKSRRMVSWRRAI